MESLKETYNKLLSNESSIHAATDLERQTIQTVELEMLDDIISCCEKYNLSILLGGGSCLGAVRHGGFIPWDDDIDLNMPRSDLEKLKDIFMVELGDKYILHAPNYGNTKSKWRFAKIEKTDTLLVDNDDKSNCTGICIDIFPIEMIPHNRILRFFHGVVADGMMFIAGQVWFAKKSSMAFRKAMKSSFSGKIRYITKMIIGNIFGVCPLYKWFNVVDKCCQYKGKTDLMGVPTGRKHYFGEIFNASVYLPAKEVSFSGHKAFLPNNEDEYLSNLYGNYMTIPPENKREHHYIYEVIIDGSIIK